MITQNPIVGKARKKLSGIYSRNLFGMNILQSCPPSKKGKLQPSQVKTATLFGFMSKMSNQVPASLLNSLFYQAPIGRSRRAEWMQQLMKGTVKDGNDWIFSPALLPRLGGNAAVTEEPMSIVPTQNHLRFHVDDFSHLSRADVTKQPCLILICADSGQCISLQPWLSMEGEEIVLSNLSPTFLNHECLLYCLWQYNAGTQQTPIYTFGAYVKTETPL